MGAMRYSALGDSGLMVSAVGVGCNAFGTRIDAEQTSQVVNAALDAGITLFDTADVYGDGASEELLGKALGKHREQVIVATKFGMLGTEADHFGAHAGRRWIRRAVEDSLRRLGTDYIDLYQLHRLDPITPIEETLQALTELVSEGKVRYLGSSNFAAWQVMDADWVARSNGLQRFISAQNEYSMYNRVAEAELVPACEQAGVGILPYFPLAYGLLTGKYRRGEQAPVGTRLARPDQAKRLAGADWDRLDALKAYADTRGISLLTLAISGLLAQPTVSSVISGATRPDQIATNIAAASWHPTDADLADLAELTHTPAFSYTTFA